MLITFEGTEGSGKSTQAKILADILDKQGYKVILTKEPGGTNIGLDIRKILLDPNNKNLHKYTELLLYIADRIQHVNELIIPSLKAGNIVICDRYSDSTIAYQQAARGINVNLIKQLHEMFLKEIKPTITFLLDINPKYGLKRCWNAVKNFDRSMTETRFEQEKIEFHNKVRNGYLNLAMEDKDRFIIIDASNNINSISQYIINKMNNFNLSKYKKLK